MKVTKDVCRTCNYCIGRNSKEPTCNYYLITGKRRDGDLEECNNYEEGTGFRKHIAFGKSRYAGPNNYRPLS